jgi:diguanylate cyclase (GGDEF)-like protein
MAWWGSRQEFDVAATASMLSAYRGRIFYSLALAGALFLLPFAINNFLQGRVWLGVLTAFVVACFFANAYATYRGRRLPVPTFLVFLPAIPALLLSVERQQIIGVLWTYPAMVLFHFVLSRRAANIFNLTLLVTVTPLAYPFAGKLLTIRIFATLALTILVTNIFSGIVNGLQQRLHELVVRDPLTGAFNRRQLAQCLEDALARRRRSGEPAALVALDLDHFKRINDERGHAEGDRVLVRAVETLRGRLREVDPLFRSGGEEFLVVLANTGPAGAATVAEELRRAIEAAPLCDDRPVTASFGVASLLPTEDAESWLRRCDHALYAAKAAGRNCVTIAGEAA